jgi:hypothetical protein
MKKINIWSSYTDYLEHGSKEGEQKIIPFSPRSKRVLISWTLLKL